MLCVTALLIYTRRKKMNIISKYGTDLYFLLIQQGFWPDTAKMITAQAAHETGNFTSTIFRLNNNPFGMKLPESRRTTAIGERSGHALYSSMESAAQDYWLYYTNRKYPLVWKDVDNFIETLKANYYFEADIEIYKKAVKHFYQLYFNEKTDRDICDRG
jgi:uncharacterized FlgJ-related protein